jgi:hypothetical protein
MEVHIYSGFRIRSADAVVVRRGALSDLGRVNVLDRAKRSAYRSRSSHDRRIGVAGARNCRV